MKVHDHLPKQINSLESEKKALLTIRILENWFHVFDTKMNIL
jgi:hypothetical protein